MRKFILMAFAGLAIMAAAPQVGSASPLMPAVGLAAAADDVALTQEVRHWRWHHRHHWRHRHWRHRHYWRHRHWRHRHWHHRHWRRW